MTRSGSIFKDIFDVMCSNIVSLISSIINGFVVPYVLGVVNYGHYRIFILYATYTALLHCGFVDGILLKFGGTPYNKLNKNEFRLFTKTFIIFQFFIFVMFLLASIIVTNKSYSVLLMFLGFYTFVFNIWTYYMFISQVSMRFRLLSFINVVQSIISIFFTILVCIIYKFRLITHINYTLFIEAYILSYFIVLLWYIFIYRDITFNNHFSIKLGLRYLYKLCKLGIYLTISYQVSNFIMVIDNQIVSMFFNARTYGKYSFSYSITNTAITILGAVSTVLLPHLKRDSYSHILKIYHKIISIMMLIVYLGLTAYFPLCLLIEILLPEYRGSLNYLRIFLPELGITCSVTMITFNYYNVLGKSKFYFFMSMCILILSLVIDSFMYILGHNPLLVAFGSFVAIFMWYIFSEYFLVKWYHVKWFKNLFYMSVMIGIFFLSSMFSNLLIGCCIYFVGYLSISMILFRKLLKKRFYILIKQYC